MKITIIECLPNNEIVFKTDFGIGKGIWKDNSKIEKREYIIEIDTPKVFKNKDIKISSISDDKIKYNEVATLVTGILENYENDGYATIRLGNNIINFETEYSLDIKKMKGKYITLVFENMCIYNTGVI